MGSMFSANAAPLGEHSSRTRRTRLIRGLKSIVPPPLKSVPALATEIVPRSGTDDGAHDRSDVVPRGDAEVGAGIDVVPGHDVAQAAVGDQDPRVIARDRVVVDSVPRDAHGGDLDRRTDVHSGAADQIVNHEPDVIDLASGIYHLRHNPPAETIRATLWSDGDRYLTEVEPLRPERRKISGHKLEVQGFKVRGVKNPGHEEFDATFTVYFTRDGRATPVEILGKRGWVKLRIELTEEQITRLGRPASSTGS